MNLPSARDCVPELPFFCIFNSTSFSPYVKVIIILKSLGVSGKRPSYWVRLDPSIGDPLLGGCMWYNSCMNHGIFILLIPRDAHWL